DGGVAGVERETFGAGVSNGVEEPVGGAVAGGGGEDGGDGGAAVAPDGLGGRQVLGLDAVPAVGQGVDEGQAQDVGPASGGEGTEDAGGAVLVVAEAVVDVSPGVGGVRGEPDPTGPPCLRQSGPEGIGVPVD